MTRITKLFALAIAVLMAATLLAVATTAVAARHMEVAVQDDHLLLNQQPYHFRRSLPQVRALNASWIRVNLVWSTVLGKQARAHKQPKRLRYQWGGYDNLVNSAAARGIQVEITITGPVPAWAEGQKRVGIYKPNARLFGRFVKDAATHFTGRVHRYSVWNEPNSGAWLSPRSRGPKLYRALYLAGYNAVKKVDAQAQVLIGETAPYSTAAQSAPLAFIRSVLCVDSRYHRHGCVGLKTDGYAHHPYDFKHKPTYRVPGADNVTVSTLSRLTTALTRLYRNGALRTPSNRVPEVYLTEYGYFSSGKYRVSAAKQASYLTRGFTVAQRNPHVRQMLQYVLVTPQKGHRAFDTSIIRRNGRVSRAYNALKSWAAKAARAGRITKPLTPPKAP